MGISFEGIDHGPAGRNQPTPFGFANDTRQSGNRQSHFRRFLPSLTLIGEDQIRANLDGKSDCRGFARVQLGFKAEDRFYV